MSENKFQVLVSNLRGAHFNTGTLRLEGKLLFLILFLARKEMTGSDRGVVKGTHTTGAIHGMPLRWYPCGDGIGPAIEVTQGDLTACALDAIVNPANSYLSHGGGVAGAISRKGGPVIDDESKKWIKENRKLPVGCAMSTRAGRLPCRFVIHTVGPMIGGGGSKQPTPLQAQQLRDAVESALGEADRLRVSSVAIPGISSGIFGYPRDLAAEEILGVCVRFARQKVDTTMLKEIALMNIDIPTCASFVQALQEEMKRFVVVDLPIGVKDKAARDLAVSLQSVSFDMTAFPVASAMVVAILTNNLRLKISSSVMHRNAASRVIGDAGALSMELLLQGKSQHTAAILQALKGCSHVHHTQSRPPFYMKA